MRRFSQAQKRIMGSLRRCFVLHAGGQMTLFRDRIAKADRVTSAAIMVKCGLCRFEFLSTALDRVAHALAHYEPIKNKVAQIETIATLAGGSGQDYYRAGELVMGWRPCTSEATDFFRNQPGIAEAWVAGQDLSSSHQHPRSNRCHE